MLGPKNNFGSKRFHLQKHFGSKNIWTNTYGVQKNMDQNILGPIEFQNNLAQKNFLVHNKFWYKTILV